MSKESKVAILALVSFAMLYFGFNFLKGKNVFSATNQYHIIYDDVQGLKVSGPVRINGFQVGQVKEISLLQQQGNKLHVVIAINDEVFLRQGTKAELASEILGGTMLNLVLPATGKTLQPGDTLNSQVKTDLTALLKEKGTSIIDNANSLMDSLKITTRVLNRTLAGFQGFIAQSSATVATVNGTLQDNRDNLLGITSNVKTLTSSLIETEKSIKPLMGKFGTVADSLAALRINQTLDETRRTVSALNTLLADLQAGKGTAGKLLKDDSAYRSLNASILNLNKLLVDFRLHPKRYTTILRRKDTPYQEPTEEELQGQKKKE
jgi:phospholipid/cholesterol/gamma-HCH transport system substrate-binding protein